MDPTWHQHSSSLHPPKELMQGRPPISFKWSYNLTLMSMVFTPQSPNHVRPFKEVITPFAPGSRAHLVEKTPASRITRCTSISSCTRFNKSPRCAFDSDMPRQNLGYRKGFVTGEQGAVLFGRPLDCKK